MMSMIYPYGLHAITEFTKTILLSRCVKDSKPLSSIIIGYPDTGKSQTILRFSKTPKVLVATDITAWGLSQFLLDISKGNIKFILIPDLAKIIVGRGKAGQALLVALNSLCEEGIYQIKTYHTTFTSTTPIICPWIASVTTDIFKEGMFKWKTFGLLSRVVPFFLGYNEEDKRKALGTIKLEEYVFPEEKLDLDSEIDVSITNGQKDFVELIASFVSAINEDFTCFRTYKNMVTFVKAHAIVRGDNKVEPSDLKFLQSLIPFWYNPAVEGSDCDYYILQSLPGSTDQIIERLSKSYSNSLIYQTLRRLKELGIISERNGIWNTTFELKPEEAIVEVQSDGFRFSDERISLYLPRSKWTELVNKFTYDKAVDLLRQSLEKKGLIISKSHLMKSMRVN